MAILKQWTDALYGLLRPATRKGQSRFARSRGPVTHVLILDGTLSTLMEGHESNAGLTYKMLDEVSGSGLSVYYEAGLQLEGWRYSLGVLMGRGINRQIRRAYGYLASRYHPGDKIVLMGYSRGAYAVRSLAGVIDRMGLLRAEHATVRNITTVYRHYRYSPDSPVAQEFRAEFCHDQTEIDMVGVWDTVKALGLRLPILWRWAESAHGFHNHRLGSTIRHGYHALALNETRRVFEPVMWSCPHEFVGRIEQVWFRGSHADIGGQLAGFDQARPLSNIPLVWMLQNLELHGVPLPEGWRARFETDVSAPSVGTWRSWGKIFLIRGARQPLLDVSERLHESVEGQEGAESVLVKSAS